MKLNAVLPLGGTPCDCLAAISGGCDRFPSLCQRCDFVSVGHPHLHTCRRSCSITLGCRCRCLGQDIGQKPCLRSTFLEIQNGVAVLSLRRSFYLTTTSLGLHVRWRHWIVLYIWAITAACLHNIAKVETKKSQPHYTVRLTSS